MPSLQIGLCGVSVSHPPPLSQLPKVTAQILAQCLKKRRDPRRGQAYQELSAHAGLCPAHKRDRVSQVLVVPRACCSPLLTDWGRGP